MPLRRLDRNLPKAHGQHEAFTSRRRHQFAVENPSETYLFDVIDSISPERGPGVIVLEKPGGDYAQSAGGDGLYVVESRHWLDDRFQTFRHFVAGMKREPGKQVKVPSSAFHVVRVNENECLNASDVKKIMAGFLRGKGRDPAYQWRDITLNF